MDNISTDVNLNYSKYGDGRAIIEILNIGFEPLLTHKEYKLYKEIGKLKYKLYGLEKIIQFINGKLLYLEDDDCYYLWLTGHLEETQYLIDFYKEKMKYKDQLFRKMLCDNTSIKRKIIDDRKFKNEDQFRNIAIFESDLTRCFGLSDMEHSDDIISVVTYYTEIFNSIMHNGFDYKDRHFIFFTAGAGQTRCKKSTFVSQDKLEETFNRLSCGLTREEINKQGGMNTNKYLAYTSLCQTNSEIWRGFNIDKAIVVDDIEYNILNQKVRYIYTETPEDKQKIEYLQDRISVLTEDLRLIKERKQSNPVGYRRTKNEIVIEKAKQKEKKELINEIAIIKSKFHKSNIENKDVIIPFTDGFGISLKKMQSSMIRLPFIKGLIAYVPRRAFIDICSENKISIHKVIDIYGKPHSINDIDYVFTKSQFKMYKYFNNILDEDENVIKTGWEVYKENFKKYNCDACRCNVERNVKLNSKTNYQILQTLTTEMKSKEIYKLAKYDIDNLNGIGSNIQCMLNVLGANPDKNEKLSYLQKSLLLYPEMFKDYYVKSLLKSTKNSMINKFRSGKFSINGAYTFAIPDPLACLQWWFTGERDLDKLGFIKENEVCCDLFKDGEEVDCLRSPHLDHAHCIRKNIKNDDTKKWVKSKGVYIGVKDIMSKLLMYDNDGDKLLVHNNKIIIDCAKRFQKKYHMIPNYYEMPKANPELLSNSSLFEGIVLAYHHGNIGTPSNEITKIFMTLDTNSPKEEVEEAMEIVALRCVDVNFTIDFAKTLYKPTIPKHVLQRYKKYSGKKVPHFFIYAKGKNDMQVEPLGTCNIDKIYSVVKSNRIVFKDLLGKYSYKMMMSNPDVDKNTDKAKEILELYNAIHTANIRRLSYVDLDSIEIDEKKKVQLQIEYDINKQRSMFIEIIGETAEYITDVLVKSLQGNINKDTLWKLFGDVIYSNLERNLQGTKICKVCGERFKSNKYNSMKVLCDGCYQKKRKEDIRINVNNVRKKRV